MHPAASVIFFTTASGAGYGMLALMGILVPLDYMPIDRDFSVVSFGLALSLVSAGLLSSTFHLGHPERAWRAVSQWRSSWLSREGVLAILTFGPSALFAYGWIYIESLEGMWFWWGIIAALFSIATIYSTSMIYASLKSIPEWHNKHVPIVYIILGLGTGSVWLVCISISFGLLLPELVWLSMAFVALGALIKGSYWYSIDRAKPESDPGTATGLGKIGTVRQLESPHTSDNWVLKEMGYVVARKHTKKLRKSAVMLGTGIPLACLLAIALDIGSPISFAVLATLSSLIGVVSERWLFFAEARHVVGLFYGRIGAGK